MPKIMEKTILQKKQKQKKKKPMMEKLMKFSLTGS